MLDPIAPDLIERFFDKRLPVSHSNIRSGIDAARGEGALERARLLFGDPSKRRASADLLVITSRFLVTLSRDQPRKRFLKRSPWEANNVGIGEEIEEKRANLFEGLRTSEIEKEDTDALLVRDQFGHRSASA